MNSKGIDCLADNGVCIPISTHSVKTVKKHTKADVIRAMNDEELAEFLERFEVCSNCEYSDKERCTFENPCVHEFATAMALKWLQSEAE